MKLVIRSKVNHDNLWLKVVDTESKSEAKIYAGRNGVKLSSKVVTGTDELQEVFDKISEEMKNGFVKSRADGNNLGVTLNLVEKQMEEFIKDF